MKITNFFLLSSNYKCSQVVVTKSCNEDEKIIVFEGCNKEKQVDLNLEDFELPCDHEDNEAIKLDQGNKINMEHDRFLTIEEETWQIVVPKSVNQKDDQHKPFNELLTYWKRKEKEEA